MNTNTNDTASASPKTAVSGERAANTARKYLLAANRLALVMRGWKTKCFAEAFEDLIFMCQLREHYFRTGPDGLLYDCLLEWYADNFKGAILAKRDYQPKK